MKRIWLQEIGNGLYQQKFDGVGTQYQEVEPPKPREWWMRCHRDAIPCPSCGLFETYELACLPASDHQPVAKIIKVREVTE